MELTVGLRFMQHDVSNGRSGLGTVLNLRRLKLADFLEVAFAFSPSPNDDYEYWQKGK